MGIFRRRTTDRAPDAPPPDSPPPSPQPVSLDDQIGTLTGFGLRPVGDPVATAQTWWPRERFEADPFATLLTVEDWSQDLKSLGDLEILDEFAIYADVLRGLAEFTGQSHRLGEIITALESQDAETGAVIAQIDGRQRSYQPDYRGDWADGMAIAEMAEDLAAPGRVVVSSFIRGAFVLAHLPADREADYLAFIAPYEGLD
ncbi:MAG: hypothetical protein U0Q21_00450 [Dermatophilaceae bacterium]